MSRDTHITKPLAFTATELQLRAVCAMVASQRMGRAINPAALIVADGDRRDEFGLYASVVNVPAARVFVRYHLTYENVYAWGRLGAVPEHELAEIIPVMKSVAVDDYTTEEPRLNDFPTVIESGRRYVNWEMLRNAQREFAAARGWTLRQRS